MIDTPQASCKGPPMRGVQGIKLVFQFALIMLVFLTLVSCGPPGTGPQGEDTCTQGDNITNPRLAAGLEETSSGHRIRLIWGPGTGKGSQLPPDYFQAVTLQGGDPVVRSIALTGEREITLELEALEAYLESSNVLELTLVFPDRRGYIDCRHAGMDDRYFVKITLQFGGDGSLQEATIDQGVWLGPI